MTFCRRVPLNRVSRNETGVNLLCSLARQRQRHWRRREFMHERFFRVAAVMLIVLVAALLAQPHLERLLFAATSPRPVAARGDLPESERATISLFERVSPSVVQVVGAAAGASA